MSDKFFTVDGKFLKIGNKLAVAAPPPPPDYLCFTANTANTDIRTFGTPMTGVNLQYSVDTENWLSFTPGTTIISLQNIGDKVYFKGNNPNGLNFEYNKISFYFSNDVSASGNIMSLIDDGQCQCIEIPNDYCFCRLFMYGGLTSAPSLPATILKNYCYSEMFQSCKITQPPALPATTLAESCYGSMFYNCTSLTTAPALPATELSYYCYQYMFSNCTSLEYAPQLPATTMKDCCYKGMFSGCTSLVTPPALPSTKCVYQCYDSMFKSCTNLTSVPALPSSTIYYGSMFYGCTSLIISDQQTEEATFLFRIPSSGTVDSYWSNTDVFRDCAGTRYNDDLTIYSGSYQRRYTQNPPVQ